MYATSVTDLGNNLVLMLKTFVDILSSLIKYPYPVTPIKAIKLQLNHCYCYMLKRAITLVEYYFCLINLTSCIIFYLKHVYNGNKISIFFRLLNTKIIYTSDIYLQEAQMSPSYTGGVCP